MTEISEDLDHTRLSIKDSWPDVCRTGVTAGAGPYDVAWRKIQIKEL